MDLFQSLIVKANSAVPEYVPLTPLDIYLGHYITGGVYFFLRTPDVERMKNALATALDRHPTFGACMVREAGGIGLNCGTTGAELSIHRSDMSCPDLRSTESLINEALANAALSAEEPASNQPVSDNNAPSYRFNSGQPVACFRLILFNDDRCALMIRHVHSQADGAGAIHFLQNWSRAYRGLPLSLPSGYTRMHVAGLATLPGLTPSSRLNIRQRELGQASENSTEDNAGGSEIPSGGSTPSNHLVRDGSSVRLDIPAAALENFMHDCRRTCRLSLTSSDILHALVWQCFVAAQLDLGCETNKSAEIGPHFKKEVPGNEQCHVAEKRGADYRIDNESCSTDKTEIGTCPDQQPRLRLYTLFDLRNIKPLGIPRDYDGSAVLGRCAEMNASEVLNWPVPELALAVRRQLKPFTADDAKTDISYLAREYDQGQLDDDGNYANFVIGAWLECRNSSGLIVNDLRRLAAADICFEERPVRMETLVSRDINMVSMYQNDDGTVTLHYVGDQRTLSKFCERVKIIVTNGPDAKPSKN